MDRFNSPVWEELYKPCLACGTCTFAVSYTHLPGKIMAFDDPENPTIMEDFIRALGAEPVIYPYRNECCGGYISLKEKDMSQNMCQKIEDSAKGLSLIHI